MDPFQSCLVPGKQWSIHKILVQLFLPHVVLCYCSFPFPPWTTNFWSSKCFIFSLEIPWAFRFDFGNCLIMRDFNKLQKLDIASSSTHTPKKKIPTNAETNTKKKIKLFHIFFSCSGFQTPGRTVFLSFSHADVLPPSTPRSAEPWTFPSTVGAFYVASTDELQSPLFSPTVLFLSELL